MLLHEDADLFSRKSCWYGRYNNEFCSKRTTCIEGFLSVAIDEAEHYVLAARRILRF